ncbi:hypothetical protein ACPOL_6028 [Acidisarcina polymorpha]|uniref:Uncharacterized protein n=1 Tax=Acidisarcina polymorpha TaxID=2211140 RepID=A0A2Z5G7N0_9BACT|nr:hypothetical protein ACPOL_6028 [Acidisarcina polymorpha]
MVVRPPLRGESNKGRVKNYFEGLAARRTLLWRFGDKPKSVQLLSRSAFNLRLFSMRYRDTFHRKGAYRNRAIHSHSSSPSRSAPETGEQIAGC